jgi:hypothetical protein
VQVVQEVECVVQEVYEVQVVQEVECVVQEVYEVQEVQKCKKNKKSKEERDSLLHRYKQEGHRRWRSTSSDGDG